MRCVDGRWLRARRDAWVDHALAYTVVPVVLLALLLLAVAPLATAAALAGFAVGRLLPRYKKIQNRFTNETLFQGNSRDFAVKAFLALRIPTAAQASQKPSWISSPSRSMCGPKTT